MKARFANRWLRTRITLAAAPALTLLAFAALTALMMWPLPLYLRDHVVKAIYHWDAYVNTMSLSSRLRNALGDGPGSIYEVSQYTSYFFAPIHDSIVFNESLFGLALLYGPFELLIGEPLAAYNITLLISMTLSQYFTFLLVRRLTGNPWAGAVCGFIFAFSPYATFEMGRIQLVATQWIPLCFLFAHRAAMEQRPRDIAGLFIAYLLQIGTCLYYAMFILPLLGLFLSVWIARRRPGKRFFLQVLGAGSVAGVIALGMTYPYFTSRDAFRMERSEDFASSFDGELSFFFNVHTTNRSLTALHHRTYEEGAHEEVAFPGFTASGLALLGLLAPLVTFARSRGRALVARWLAFGLGTLALALLATALSHSMLVGALLLGAGVLVFELRGHESPYPPVQRTLVWMLLLSVVLFLGLFPFSWQGEPVRGLYYYLHTFVPGFNGIRKVSRQACMTTLMVLLVAGFGGRAMFARLPNAGVKAVVLAGVLSLCAWELRTFPNELAPIWAGDSVPEAYRFIARQPGHAPVAVTPAYFGRRRFRGHHGMAIHNYMATYHRRRTLNGKSTFIPPVTHLVHQALRALPTSQSTRVLQILGAEFLLLHTEDIPRHRSARILAGLDKQRDAYERVFQDGPQFVYRLLPNPDPTLGLIELPERPGGTVPVPHEALSGTASRELPTPASRAVDGDLESGWRTHRNMRRGDWFELSIDAPHTVHMLELHNQSAFTDHPLSFELAVEDAQGRLRTVYRRPRLKLFRELVYRPKGFVFRVALPKPTRTRRVRITVLEPMPARWWTIDEARLLVSD